MSKLNVLSASDLSPELLDQIIEKLDENEVESAMIMGFATDEETSNQIESFSEKLKDRLANRAAERARQDEPKASSSLDDYVSLADVSDEKRRRILAAVTFRAILGKGKGLNEVLVTKALAESLNDD